MQPEGDKRVCLLTFCFYFRLACFTYLSLHPEVDKFNFSNKDFSLDMLYVVFKIDMLIFDTMMEGTESQNFDLGPRFYFMKRRKLWLKKYLKVPLFF